MLNYIERNLPAASKNFKKNCVKKELMKQCYFG